MGGLLAGTPGAVEPTKLFALRGAGTDAAGNLYVAMRFGGTVSGNLVLRSFTPSGQLRWELHNHAFVDTFGFDPASDGARVYGRTAAFDLDLNRTVPGSEWHLAGITLDALHAPDDPRLKSGMTAYLRRVHGRRLLACIGQYGGGYHLYTFDEPGGFTAHPAGQATEAGRETWAWDMTDNGDIWQGDAAGDRIVRHRFKGWSPDGKPQYETAESWPRPDDFQLVRRVFYRPETDSLYVFGYLKDQKADSWDVVGFTARSYNGWLAGQPVVAWTNSDPPINPKGSDKGGPLSGQGVAIAGDYIFLGMVKPDDGKQYTHILRAADGTYVGSFSPGPEVGGNAGWQDMPYSVAAIKRRNGEYLVLAEEDWRGKNLLYRWMPAP